MISTKNSPKQITSPSDPQPNSKTDSKKGKTQAGISVTGVKESEISVQNMKSEASAGTTESKPIEQRDNTVSAQKDIKPQTVSDNPNPLKEEDTIMMIDALKPGIADEQKSEIIEAIINQKSVFDVIKMVLQLNPEFSDLDEEEINNFVLLNAMSLKEECFEIYKSGESKKQLEKIKVESCSLLVKKFAESRKKAESLFNTLKKTNSEITESQAKQLISDAQINNLTAYDVIEKALKLSSQYNDEDVDLTGVVLSRLANIKG